MAPYYSIFDGTSTWHILIQVYTSFLPPSSFLLQNSTIMKGLQWFFVGLGVLASISVNLAGFYFASKVVQK